MRCTLEGETRRPRARSSRATRIFPHSGRSLASESTATRAAFAARVAPRSAALVIPLVVIVVAVSAADEVRFRLDAAAARVMRVLRIRAERPRAARERVSGGSRRTDDA